MPGPHAPRYRLTDPKSGKTYSMPWDKPVPPTKQEARQFIWEQENPSFTQKIGRLGTQAVDLGERALSSLGSGLNWIDTMGGRSPGGMSGVLQKDPETGELRSVPSKSILPDLEHPEDESWFGHVARGAYNTLLAPMASSEGMLYGSMPGGPKNVPGGLSKIPPAARRGRGPGGPKGPFKAGPAVMDAEFTVAGDIALPSAERKALPPIPEKGLPPASRTFYSGPAGVSEDITEIGGRYEAPGITPKVRSWADAQARLREGVPDKGARSLVETPTMDVLEQTSPYGVHYLRRMDDIPEAPIGRGAAPTSTPLDDFEVPVAPKTKPQAAPTTGQRPFSKFSDDDVSFLAEAGDADALAEVKARPTLRQRLAHLLKDEKGELRMGPFGRGVDEAADAAPYTGPERREADWGLPAGVAKDRRPPAMKAPMPSDARMDELVAKFGGKGKVEAEPSLWKKFLEDERGFMTIPSMGNPLQKLKQAINPAKGTPYEQDFAQWVNNIRSSEVEGILKGREFEDLSALGTQGIHAFQSGSRTGRLKDVADYFDKKYIQLKKQGVPLNYRENYIPQIWKDDPAKVQDVYRRLGLKPGFTLERVFDNYAEGIAAGLEPKFENIGELVNWYERKANKAIADRQFYELAKSQNWIKPQGKGGPDWKILDPNHFPHVKVKGKGHEVKILPMTAPPELHEIITNYLGEPNKVMDWLANKASITKNYALSAGLPYTGVNAHGFNILARTLVGDTKNALKTGYFLLNPKAARRQLDAALTRAPEAVKNGLTLTTEGYKFGEQGSASLAGSGIGKKFLGVTGKMFEAPLFQNVLPAVKLKHYEDMTQSFLKQGMGKQEAGRAAAEFTNNLYGGINWEAMGRSRDFQNLGRMAILAPDWLETNVRMGAGTAKAANPKNLLNPKTPQGRAYRKAIFGLMGTYAAANAVNFALSGKPMWDNAPGHSLDIDLGETASGKKRWIRPWGTSADFLRLPMDMGAAALRQGDYGHWEPDFGSASRTAKNRLSIPAATGINLLTGRDDFGRPLFGEDDYGRPISAAEQGAGVALELGDLIMPPYLRSPIDYGLGKVGGEEAVMGSIESPLRYSAPETTPSGGRGRSRTRPTRGR